jgi:MSHA biogenesis protein MshK
MKAERRKAEGSAQPTGSSFPLHPSSFALFLVLLTPGLVVAQGLTDPTRPPPGLDAGEADAGGAHGAVGMTLQSVMISPTQKAAIISGVMVKLGEKYGDAVLVRIAENEVVLKSRNASQVLKLHPGVEKRESAAAAGSARRNQPKSANPAPPR